jgi:hypothetical protein
MSYFEFQLLKTGIFCCTSVTQKNPDETLQKFEIEVDKPPKSSLKA